MSSAANRKLKNIRRNGLALVFCFPLFFSPCYTFADTVDSGWIFGLSCNAFGTTGSGSFTFAQSSLSGSSGSCERTSNAFTQLSLGSYSGSGTPLADTVYAVNTGDVLIVPPLLSTEYEPIFSVANAAVAIGPYTANWIEVQWPNSTETLTGTYLIGQATIDPSTSAGGNGIVLTGQWDIDGNPYWSGSTNMPGTWGTDDNAGVYTASGGGGALEGVAYFTSAGAGAYKANPGSATFFFPQQAIFSLETLAGITFSGIMFDANQSTGGDVTNVQVVSNAYGTAFTVTPFSDVGTNTLSPSFYDTISISNENYPANGIFVGTVTRTGTGAGTGNLACIVNITTEDRVICSGQSPSNNSIPYNVSFAYTAGGTGGPNIYISDTYNSVIREVDGGTGIITTIAGNGTPSYTGDGNPATSATLNNPTGITLDSSGNIYISDWTNNVIREVYATTGIITTYTSIELSDCPLMAIAGLAMDPGGTLYIADYGSNIILPSGYGYESFVGDGDGGTGYSGDGGYAASAKFNYPKGVAADGAGNLFIADTGNNVVRFIYDMSTVSTIAGNYSAGPGYSGDGGPATSAQLNGPSDVALDSAGNLYIADSNNNVIREVNATTGIITTVAGNQAAGAGYSGDGMPATSAQLKSPTGIAVDTSGNIYISDTGNSAIRLVSAGIITTIAGSSFLGAGYSGDGGSAISAQLNGPQGIALAAIPYPATRTCTSGGSTSGWCAMCSDNTSVANGSCNVCSGDGTTTANSCASCGDGSQTASVSNCHSCGGTTTVSQCNNCTDGTSAPSCYFCEDGSSSANSAGCKYCSGTSSNSGCGGSGMCGDGTSGQCITCSNGTNSAACDGCGDGTTVGEYQSCQNCSNGANSASCNSCSDGTSVAITQSCNGCSDGTSSANACNICSDGSTTAGSCYSCSDGSTSASSGGCGYCGGTSSNPSCSGGGGGNSTCGDGSLGTCQTCSNGTNSAACTSCSDGTSVAITQSCNGCSDGTSSANACNICSDGSTSASSSGCGYCSGSSSNPDCGD